MQNNVPFTRNTFHCCIPIIFLVNHALDECIWPLSVYCRISHAVLKTLRVVQLIKKMHLLTLLTPPPFYCPCTEKWVLCKCVKGMEEEVFRCALEFFARSRVTIQIVFMYTISLRYPALTVKKHRLLKICLSLVSPVFFVSKNAHSRICAISPFHDSFSATTEDPLKWTWGLDIRVTALTKAIFEQIDLY